VAHAEALKNLEEDNSVVQGDLGEYEDELDEDDCETDSQNEEIDI
jgi:hypothetical protein|tara:strand:- start:1109 stop:1243 length:135 start_codon:yes stop_codon:yes gene_type:complete